MKTLAACISLVVAACAGEPSDASQFASAASGCERGDARSCALAAVRFRNGVGVIADRAKAAAFSERSCTLGFAIGCNDLGVSYFDGWGVPVDKARAVTLFTEACEHGAVIACINRAMTAEQGEPDALDTRAFGMLESACETGHKTDWLEWQPHAHSSGPCGIAGKMQLVGRGTPANARAARALFAKGCTTFETAFCDDAKSPDGEDCSPPPRWGTFGCRGDASHSSSCVGGICVADVLVGASCAARACTRGAYCDETHTCAAKKPMGAACTTFGECESSYCQRQCESAPMQVNGH